MTPILDAANNAPEERYTTTHIRARNTIERCIGLLKQRFRCLLQHRTLHYDPVRAGKIIYSCVVLHNFINRQHEEDVEDDANDEVNIGQIEAGTKTNMYICLHVLTTTL